jgi:hypothetical protein
MTRRAASVLAMVIALLGAVTAGCGDDGSTPTATSEPSGGLPELRIVVRDVAVAAPHAHAYAYDLPAHLDAGPRRLVLDNRSRSPHHAQLFRLRNGASLTQLRAALAGGDPAAALAFGAFAGGPAIVAPGTTSFADPIVHLAAGRYALICFVEDDGVPHFAEGMLRAFDVSAARGDDAGLPTASVDADLVDYGFDLPSSVRHDAVLAVHNRSKGEPHEMIVARVHDGATARAAVEALTAGAPAPVTEVGGVQALLPAGSQLLQLSVPPGEYVVFCEIPSVRDGRAHAMKGMVRPLRVT